MIVMIWERSYSCWPPCWEPNSDAFKYE